MVRAYLASRFQLTGEEGDHVEASRGCSGFQCADENGVEMNRSGLTSSVRPKSWSGTVRNDWRLVPFKSYPRN